MQVEKLVQAGLIERQSIEGDRRSVSVMLTEQGKVVFQEHNALHLTLTDELTRPLSQEQQSELSKMLTLMNKEF